MKQISARGGGHGHRHKQPPQEIVIDITGPDGNAFVLLGYAHHMVRQLELDWKTIEAEMTSGDPSFVIVRSMPAIAHHRSLHALK